VQRIDLRSTLVLLLVKHPSRQRQRASKDNLPEQVGAAFDLAGNVADDTSEIGSKRPQGPVGALELLGVGIALMLDQGELAHPHVGLPQRKAMPLCKPDQDLARPDQKPRIRREHHVLGLYRGVDDDAIEVGRFDRLGLGGDRKAQQRLQLLLAHALAPACQRGAVEHQAMLKDLFAAEELV
jgi:hypothetical protein